MPQVRVRYAWQQGGDPLIGSNGAVRGMPTALQPGGVLTATLWSAPAHPSLPTHLCHHAAATIDAIRAHFGNPTQITLFRMPMSAGSLHEKQCITADLACWPQPAILT